MPNHLHFQKSVQSSQQPPAPVPDHHVIGTRCGEIVRTGVKLHGCTVHFVTAQLDSGPIVIQAAVRVLAGERADETQDAGAAPH